MRFRRTDPCPWFDTPAKRAALRRRQRLEREAFPLLAALIAERQPTEDEVMAQRAVAAVEWEQKHRDYRAAQWRRARRALAALGHNIRPLALRYWNTHRWLPADPSYLLDMVHSIETGRLTPNDAGQFRFDHRPERALPARPAPDQSMLQVML